MGRRRREGEREIAQNLAIEYTTTSWNSDIVT